MSKSNHTNGGARDVRPLVLLVVGLLIVGGHFFRFGPLDLSRPVFVPFLSERSFVWYNNGDLPAGFYLLRDSVRPFETPSPRDTRPHPRLTPFFFLPLPINACDEELLITLPGIGPTLAGRIMQYRLEHGGFKSVDELLLIKGIGPAKLKEIRNSIVIE